MWKLDTTKHGFEKLLKPYQYKMLQLATEQRHGITTGDMHDKLFFHDIETSRASVINYLRYLEEYGLMDFTEESGKGGYHRVYSMKLTMEELETRIAHDIIRNMLEVFPNCEYLRYLNKEI